MEARYEFSMKSWTRSPCLTLRICLMCMLDESMYYVDPRRIRVLCLSLPLRKTVDP